MISNNERHERMFYCLEKGVNNQTSLKILFHIYRHF